MLLIHYYSPANLSFMAIFAWLSDEETLKTWSYSVVDKACLTTGLNHNSYEVVERMNPHVSGEGGII